MSIEQLSVAPSPVPVAAPAATLMVVPWHDPIVDTVGFDVRSNYVELFWLNVLGPPTIEIKSRRQQKETCIRLHTDAGFVDAYAMLQVAACCAATRIEGSSARVLLHGFSTASNSQPIRHGVLGPKCVMACIQRSENIGYRTSS
ncbi:MAG: hypothetical protein IPL07_06145 [Acidimicrobiaceae bacterium]|nr:hypothetical protein [Acidimicrobiaceae bacterium]